MNHPRNSFHSPRNNFYGFKTRDLSYILYFDSKKSPLMLFSSFLLAFDIHQELHQFVLNNQPISIHYTQLKVDPLTVVRFTPTRLLIKNEVIVVDTLTSNRFGEVYFRYPIFSDEDIHVLPINIEYKNANYVVDLDKVTHLELSAIECNNEELLQNLKTVSQLTLDVKMKKKDISFDVSSLPDLYYTNGHLEKLKKLWEWLKNEFKKASKTILSVVQSIQKAFDFGKMKSNRNLMWHYLNLVFEHGLSNIKNINLSKVKPSDFGDIQSSQINIKAENSNNLLFGSFLESIDMVHSQSPIDLVSNYNYSSHKLNSILTPVMNHTNTTEYNDLSDSLDQLKSINTKSILSDVLQSLNGVLNGIWKGFKSIIIKLFQIVTDALKPLISIFSRIQFGIATLPLIIPGITTWISSQLNDKLRLIDFFLLPLAAKINLIFNKHNIEFTTQDQQSILSCKTFEELQYLDYDTLLRLHWADQTAFSFSLSYQTSFVTLSNMPVVDWINPLWNSASFISSILSSPHDIFRPVYKELDVRIYIARLFSNSLGFLPNPFVFMPNVVEKVLKLVVFKIPLTIKKVRAISKRSTNNLPVEYKRRRFMLVVHQTLDVLRLGLQYFTFIPGGSLLTTIGLSLVGNLIDYVVDQCIGWNSKVAK
eukprot:NODE_90_length_21806_cov_0.389137.p2 type:complete len:648 gc:universal NODE_90_length_21806_cov_0.389137:2983-1040(-)